MRLRRTTRWGVAAIFAILAAVPATVSARVKPPPGFTSLFDGKTLKGWRGDARLWSVRDGAITGGLDAPIAESSFLISSRNVGDFEARFKFRFAKDGNSGFQFRSRISDPGTFMVAGYQANVVPPDQEARYGMLYDNLGRNEIALLGERVEISDAGGKLIRNVRGSVNPMATLRAAYRPYPAWNDYVVIAYGVHIIHAINGQLILDAIDNAPGAARDGMLALQVDFGKPMFVQFKDISVKSLAASPNVSGRFSSTPGPAETTSAIPRRPTSR